MPSATAPVAATRTSPFETAAAVDDALRAAGLSLAPAPQVATDRVATDPTGRAHIVRPASGRTLDGTIAYTTRRRTGAPRPEFWAVWHVDADRVYLVPDQIAGASMGMLRLERPRNGQQASTNPAAAYELTALHGHLAAGRWPVPVDPTALDTQLTADLARLGGIYRTGNPGRQAVADLQQLLGVAAEQGANNQAIADAAGIGIDQVRALAAASRQGRVAGHDVAPGRKSKAELAPLADALRDHPAADAHRHLAGSDPATFLFEVAITATDGTPPAVRRFLEGAGWEGVSKGTVHRRLKLRAA